MANSLMFSLPRSTAPASFRLLMTVASSSGTKSFRMVEPPVVRIPLVFTWSLTAMGTPCIGPRYLPETISCSAFLASASARSVVTVM